MADDLPYQVSWLPEAEAIVKELHRDARSPAAREELTRVIRTYHHQLQRDPFVIGNIYNVAGNIQERFAVVDSLLFEFAVDTHRHFVTVRKCQALWRGNGRVPE
jgi:hypothetical protein